MDREILCRGKRVDNGEWVEGDLLRSRGKCYIHEHIDPFDYLGELSGFIKMYEVAPETVSEFTGLTDKNGTKIFEGDIIKYHLWDDKFDYCEVKFDYFYAATDSYNGGPALGFYLADINGNADDIGFFKNMYKYIEVIGNIHDNPELLEEEV